MPGDVSVGVDGLEGDVAVGVVERRQWPRVDRVVAILGGRGAGAAVAPESREMRGRHIGRCRGTWFPAGSVILVEPPAGTRRVTGVEEG